MTQLVKIVQICTFLGITTILLSIAASETFLALAFLFWLPIGLKESWKTRRLAVDWPPYFLALQCYVGVTVLSVFLSQDPHLGFAAIRKFSLVFISFLVVRFFDRHWTKLTFFTLFGLGGLAGVVGVVQFFIKWDQFHHTGSPADDPTLIFRVHGFMGHWMTFSGEQLLVISALLGFLALFPIQKRSAWVLATIMISASIFFSFTRSVWLALFCVFGVVLVWFRKKILFVIPTVVVLVALAFPQAVHERLDSFLDTGFSSNAARLEMARAGWEMFKQHPWFGVGPGRVEAEFAAILKARGVTNPPFYLKHLHNNFIQIAAERGAFALLAFVWLIIELIVRFWRRSQETSFPIEHRAISLAGLLSTIALVVTGLFEYNFNKSEIMILFLFLISAPYARESTDPRLSISTTRL